MATVQTLKDKNNDTFYPVTKTEAVYNADGSETLDTTIDNFSNVAQNLSDTKATISTSIGDANKMMKADGTKALVGSDNIDLATLYNAINISDYYASGFTTQSNFNMAVKVFGKLVFISGSCVGNLTAGTATTVLTMPTGWWPVSNTSLPAWGADIDTQVRGWIRSATGAVVLRSTTNLTNKELNFSGWYMLP